jgi:hypothetical protein
MSWRMRDGTYIDVNDMEMSHIERTLKMLIKKYMVKCWKHGAQYACQLNVDKMEDGEKRELLINTCNDRRYLKKIVMEGCFGPIEYKRLMNKYESKN